MFREIVHCDQQPQHDLWCTVLYLGWINSALGITGECVSCRTRRGQISRYVRPHPFHLDRHKEKQFKPHQTHGESRSATCALGYLLGRAYCTGSHSHGNNGAYSSREEQYYFSANCLKSLRSNHHSDSEQYFIGQRFV